MDECEIVGHHGGFKTVGIGGALTGESVDVLIMDDLYKDAMSAWSPIVRRSVYDWYNTVAETRLHNDSQQLIVFTRWHEDDLAGQLLVDQGEFDPIDNPNGWVVIIYRAIKVGAPTEYDNRQDGEPLWKERHSLEKLQSIRARNPQVFESLYQQDPKPAEGLMYNIGFREYEVRPPAKRVIRKSYIDTADTGADYLCAIAYDETEIANYIVDVMYTLKPMEYTEVETANFLTRNGVTKCVVESNNGGRGFARAVERNCRLIGNDYTQFDGSRRPKIRMCGYSNSAAVQNLNIYAARMAKLFPELQSHYQLP